MIQKIRGYVDDMFREAPQTKQARDLKEEVCSNLIDKYVDLTGGGMPEEEAYAAAVASIGDIDALLAELKDAGQSPMDDPRARRRSALLVSGAVGLYILSVVPVILVGESGDESAAIKGVVAMFVLCAIATMMLIFNAMTKPKYRKMDDTMVEEFREWKHTQKQGNSLYNALSGALWMLIVAAYFLISFLCDAWPVSWILFLVAIALQQILRAVFILRKQ